MPKKTAKGMFCSPSSAKGGGKSGASCYSKQQLVEIANAYNQNQAGSGGRINTNGNKEELWNAIEQRMVRQCDNEMCWLDKLGLDKKQTLTSAFRPIRPVGKRQWLSTTDIRDVLKQYEDLYPEFIFLGPTSIDFCHLNNEVCNINLKSSKRNGKTKIGIVFNTDPSSEPGKHWISMFIDISSADPSKHEIGYFDSFGLAPLLPEIRMLISNLRTQNPDIKLKLNCNDKICTRAIRHQKANTECGVYSINFIVTRLTGKSWEDIVINGHWSDEEMVKMREVYFRPTKH